MKRAFTLIEIIFVLIVLGILAAVGSEVLFKVYENYLFSRSVENSSYKLDVALLQITKRLSYRIPSSEIVRDSAGNINTLNIPASSAYSHLEWIGRAYEAKRGLWNGNTYAPGWSGLADLSQSSKQRLVTPGSNLSYAKQIISSVYGRNLDNPNNGCAVVFYDTYSGNPINAFGWDGSTPNAIYTVHRQNNKTFIFDNASSKRISDIYDLTCSAYAIRHENNNTLTLYYNYRPWLGETYQNGQSITLVDNVTSFQIRKRDRSIEIRLCVEDNTTGTPVEFCGKKVVF